MPCATRHRGESGFTFLELVVVMTILSLLFFFSLPSLESYIFTDPSKKVARLIAATVQDLKQRALTDQKEYRLYIATDAGELWVADASMDKKALAEARKSGFSLPQDMAVALPGYLSAEKDASSEAMLRFYPRGYSDGAEILLVRDDQTMRLMIEPFLSRVEILEDHDGGF
ncbi:type II secretion system protein [Desulfoluna sp.]|uniref:pilus assembly FimT family protein n=1 Tax=Desulfoluna sp. TaxID=2045199 RepID=UPI0026258382|nr:type II secretion system protein [Desulfoluna sp.]